ncbi:MAG: Abi-alpha family protein [Acidimicrobiales bacterium]
MSDTEASLVSAIPGLVRVAATASWRIVEWTVTTSTSTASNMVRAVMSGESAAKVVADTVVDVRATALRALGLSGRGEGDGPVVHTRPGATPEELRARGAQLLYDSADVWFEANTHPAYARILDELAPDEARILRFLAIEGPQAAVDVRTGRPLGVGSELIAGGLSMIGLQAGVRNQAATQPYLNNLYRLGLVWFSREQVADPTVYQVVEVQPDVAEAKTKAGRSAKTVHRSIHLTPFGEDFCQTCLPLGAVGSPQNGA